MVLDLSPFTQTSMATMMSLSKNLPHSSATLELTRASAQASNADRAPSVRMRMLGEEDVDLERLEGGGGRRWPFLDSVEKEDRSDSVMSSSPP